MVGVVLFSLCVLLSVCVSNITATSSPFVPLPQQVSLHATLNNGDKPISKLSFGSCNREDLPQPMWDRIVLSSPELWIWLGDVIYADTYFLVKFIRMPSPLSVMKQKFEKQKKNPLYGKLLDTSPVIGVWDDHDYGENDGDETYKDKVSSQQLFLDFVDEPVESPRRTRKGSYTSYVYGPIGKQIKVILLDIRYHQAQRRDDMLGEEQWTWLEKEIHSNVSQLTIIGSGIQVASWGKIVGEGWKMFPASRQRLFHLMASGNPNLADSEQSAFMLMSGDVHFAESSLTHVLRSVSVSPAPEASKSVRLNIMPVFDLTSSGLTHSWGESYGPEGIMMPLLSQIFPIVCRQHLTTLNKSFYLRKNFASFSIDWDASDPVLTARVTGLAGDVPFEHTFKFSELRIKHVDVVVPESNNLEVPSEADSMSIRFEKHGRVLAHVLTSISSPSTSSSFDTSFSTTTLADCLEEATTRQVAPFSLTGIHAFFAITLILAAIIMFWCTLLRRACRCCKSNSSGNVKKDQ